MWSSGCSANLGSKTRLITMDMNKIGQMSCNPAVGDCQGTNRQRDWRLGGYMGLVTDKTAIQFRMLNRSKGPAMWESARPVRPREIYLGLERNSGEPAQPAYLARYGGRAVGGERRSDRRGDLLGSDVSMPNVWCWLPVLSLNGLMHIGHKMLAGGRCAEPASYHLTESITRHGITAGRMKNGYPVRIDGKSVHLTWWTHRTARMISTASRLSANRATWNSCNAGPALPTKRCTTHSGKDWRLSLSTDKSRASGPRYRPVSKPKSWPFPISRNTSCS